MTNNLINFMGKKNKNEMKLIDKNTLELRKEYLFVMYEFFKSSGYEIQAIKNGQSVNFDLNE